MGERHSAKNKKADGRKPTTTAKKKERKKMAKAQAVLPGKAVETFLADLVPADRRGGHVNALKIIEHAIDEHKKVLKRLTGKGPRAGTNGHAAK